VSAADRLRRAWNGFVGLFGLNACPAPPPLYRETAAQRSVRERLEQRLRGGPAAQHSAPPPGPRP
jgi:hypothetical protein